MKKIFLFFIAALLLATCCAGFAGCGSDDLGFIEGHKYPETLKVRMISRDIYHNNGNSIGNAEKDTMVKYFEEKFNVKFEFIYTPSPSQNEVFEKINMMIVTNDIPDIIEVRNDNALAMDIYESLHENDLVVNAKEYVNENAERYPVLMELLNDQKVNTKLFTNKDGSLTMIPRYFGTIDHGFIMRKDWIDSYNGGVVPKTYLELEQMLRNFKAAKPGGIEQIGLSLPSSWWLSHMYAGFVGGNTWTVKNGKYEYGLVTEEQKEAYTWLNKMYREKLLDNALFTKKDEKDAMGEMIAGRTGAVMMGVTYSVPYLEEQMAKNYPDVEFVYSNISGPRGKMRLYISEFFEGCVIRKDFKDYPRLFDMVEYILSDEGDMMMKYGIEGVHYTKDGDKMIINNEKRKAEGWNGRRHGLSAMFNVEAVLDENFSNDYESIEKFIEKLNEPNASFVNPLEGVMTDAEKNVGSKPWDVAGKYTIAFINGTYNLNKWDEFVYEINNAGLKAIIDEINSKYKP